MINKLEHYMVESVTKGVTMPFFQTPFCFVRIVDKRRWAISVSDDCYVREVGGR